MIIGFVLCLYLLHLVQEKQKANPIYAFPQRIWADPFWGLCVELIPTGAKTGTPYVVELYEEDCNKDSWHIATEMVTWNKFEIKVDKMKRVYFPLPIEERDAYAEKKDLSDIFRVEVK